MASRKYPISTSPESLVAPWTPASWNRIDVSGPLIVDPFHVLSVVLMEESLGSSPVRRPSAHGRHESCMCKVQDHRVAVDVARYRHGWVWSDCRQSSRKPSIIWIGIRIKMKLIVAREPRGHPVAAELLRFRMPFPHDIADGPKPALSQPLASAIPVQKGMRG